MQPYGSGLSNTVVHELTIIDKDSGCTRIIKPGELAHVDTDRLDLPEQAATIAVNNATRVAIESRRAMAVAYFRRLGRIKCARRARLRTST